MVSLSTTASTDVAWYGDQCRLWVCGSVCLCVRPCRKKKTASAINTKVGRDIALFGKCKCNVNVIVTRLKFLVAYRAKEVLYLVLRQTFKTVNTAFIRQGKELQSDSTATANVCRPNELNKPILQHFEKLAVDWSICRIGRQLIDRSA